MGDNLDILILGLNELKSRKAKREEEYIRQQRIFEVDRQKMNESSAKILNYLKLIKDEIEICESNKLNFLSKLDTWNFNTIPGNNKTLRYKKYEFRLSNLSVLLNKDSYQTIYNIFLSFLFLLIGISVTHEYIENNRFFNIEIFYRHFQGSIDFITYFILKMLISQTYIIFINILKNYYQKGEKFISRLVFYISIVVLLFSFRFIFHIPENWSILLKVMHYCDNAKVIMKIYAYYCEKVLLVSYILSKNENNQEGLDQLDNDRPGTALIIKDDGVNEMVLFEFRTINIFKEFRGFLYFYLSPTLIYRDTYPTNAILNVMAVFKHFIHMFLTIIFIILLFEIKIYPLFSDTSAQEVDSYTLYQTLVTFIIYSIILLFMCFFGIIHSFMNFLAEIMKFGDRKFYSTFYSAKNPMRFYKRLMLFYNDFLENYFCYYYGELFNSIIRLIFTCFLAEYIFLNSTGLYPHVNSFIIIMLCLISYPLSFLKSQRKILLTWLAVSLALGVLVLVNFIDYYISQLKESDLNYSRLILKIWHVLNDNFY